MTKSIVLLAAGVSMLSAQYKAAPAEVPTAHFPAGFASELAPGSQITDKSGKPYCEIWFRKTAPTGPKSTDDAVTLQTVPQGSFIGAIRFDEDGFDRRGQKVKAGVYILRYAWMPISGDHLGAAPQRDFALMIPASDESDPKAVLSAKEAIEKSRKASGTPHPAVLSLASGTGAEGFAKEGDHDWTLNTKIGDQAVSVILIGKAEN